MRKKIPFCVPAAFDDFQDSRWPIGELEIVTYEIVIGMEELVFALARERMNYLGGQA